MPYKWFEGKRIAVTLMLSLVLHQPFENYLLTSVHRRQINVRFFSYVHVGVAKHHQTDAHLYCPGLGSNSPRFGTPPSDIITTHLHYFQYFPHFFNFFITLKKILACL